MLVFDFDRVYVLSENVICEGDNRLEDSRTETNDGIGFAFLML